MKHKLTPVKTYSPPNIPTLAEKPPLSQLPKRWAKNVAVLACVGVLGASALFSAPLAAANAEPPATQYTQTLGETRYSDLDINVRLHHGGSGSAWYVVHLTEQEMRNIVLEELRAAGLRPVPARFARVNLLETLMENAWIDDREHRLRPAAIDLFDVRRRVGISFISWERNNQMFRSWGGDYLAQQYAERFARHPALTATRIGVFYNPGVGVGSEGYLSDNEEWIPRVPPNDEELGLAVPVLVARVRAQVQRFLGDNRVGRRVPSHGLEFTMERGDHQYTVQLSEQQALAIIREQLEVAGLDLSTTPPNRQVRYTYDPYRVNTRTLIATLALFDAQANVAVSLLNNASWHDPWNVPRVAEQFARNSSTTVGVFFNPFSSLPTTSWRTDRPITVTQAQAAAAAYVMQAELVRQVQTFITHLQAEGIL
ncbi:MAG: hypothetical protein FWD06_09810 [Oscillospiraceae bacterium]|nr:hypothetical protein [Oscillospiraceae bacterium]